ncbi:MAG: hypothetical protein GY719_06875 [bacterium]|nr:hypothetical protein [bacterium]
MKPLKTVLLLALALVLLGCEERTERTDSGGVLLEVEFVNTVIRVGVEETEVLQIETITVNSIVADPNATSSSLMDVQLRTLEVTFTRADQGTRVPPPYVFNIISTVPVGGTLTLTDFPVMSSEQTRTPPLSDLLIINGGFDRETGDTIIRLNLTIRVFGTTLSGTSVSSVPRTQTLEFVSTLL